MGEVIKFPNRSSAAETAKAPVSRPVNKKSSLAVVIVLLAFSIGGNMYLRSNVSAQGTTSLASQGRKIASLSESTSGEREAVKDQSRAIQYLAKNGKRTLASLGQDPSAEDRLRFQTLDDRYHLSFTNGVLTSMEFVHDDEMNSDPRFIHQSREQFLREYRQLLPAFDHIKSLPQQRTSEGFREEFILEQSSKEAFKVSFFFDSPGRLLSMKVLNLTP